MCKKGGFRIGGSFSNLKNPWDLCSILNQNVRMVRSLFSLLKKLLRKGF
jgi:hypothetical protein